MATKKDKTASKKSTVAKAGRPSAKAVKKPVPEGGCWASDPGDESWDDSWDLFFCSDRLSIGNGTWRHIGLSVRPVQGFTR